jgi:hypothetical protein
MKLPATARTLPVRGTLDDRFWRLVTSLQAVDAKIPGRGFASPAPQWRLYEAFYGPVFFPSVDVAPAMALAPAEVGYELTFGVN